LDMLDMQALVETVMCADLDRELSVLLPVCIEPGWGGLLDWQVSESACSCPVSVTGLGKVSLVL